ncbi:MAG: hypothetical protein A2Z25_16445 [Planctomycetes bacterium RBG_16_55_9]|nr:MAG: hypothetical protein A2Z25_16445 [Planctomycetes bacterium RBG_16_55_9]
MGGLFYNLGKKVGPKVRKARWMWLSATGSEADAIAVEYSVGVDLAHEIRSQLDLAPGPRETRDEGRGTRDERRRAHRPSSLVHRPSVLSSSIVPFIGRRLADCVANKYRRFAFEIAKDAEPNAFALPGGFIFVTQSLVDLCRGDRDAIAFILGHEMAHVIRGHAMNRIVSSSAINIACRVAPTRGLLSGWLRRVGVQFLQSAYSQDMESQADRLALRLVAAAGYDPKGGVRLFERLAALSAAPSQIDLGKYFSSHPSFEARIRAINKLLGNRRSKILNP